MTYGQIVARRWKRQYCKRGKWEDMYGWDIQPEESHTILLELKSKKAITALLNTSWVRRLPRNPQKVKFK